MKRIDSYLKDKAPRVMITVRLPKDLKERIEFYRKKKGIKLQEFVEASFNMALDQELKRKAG